jgi:RNA polymerase sigma-70 factor (ECF subfamily)
VPPVLGFHAEDGHVRDFDEFTSEHYGQVLRTVALAIGDRSRAEDATQEAFLKAFRKWRTVRSMERPESWLLVVAMNAERRRWRRVPVVVRGEVECIGVPDHAGAVSAAVSVDGALRLLTPRQRTAVVLRYLADLPISAIARALGCADGTAKATLHQALAKLRVELTDGEP